MPLNSFHRRIADSDPRDSSVQLQFARRMRGLRDTLQRNMRLDLANQLDLAIELIGFLVRGEELDADNLLRLVSETVESVEQALAEQISRGDKQDPYTNNPSALARAASGDAAEGGLRASVDGIPGLASPGRLRVRSEKLLGEILLQMSFVDEAQLQRGLQIQRATGQRIGEALVSLGCVTWSKSRKRPRSRIS